MSDASYQPNLKPAAEVDAAAPVSARTLASPDPVSQIRFQLACLAVALVVLSLAFSVFVMKQNRNISFAIRVCEQQTQQTTELLKRWQPVLNELAGYSLNNAQLSAIFSRYGLQINAPPSAGR